MKKVLLATALLSLTVGAQAAEVPKQEKKQTPLGLYVDAKEAYDIKTKSPETLFIDVRTRGEVQFLGWPTVADKNIPYMIPDGWAEWDEEKSVFKLVPNSDFLTAMDEFVTSRGMNKDSEILLYCRSGSRSAKAVNLMAQAGYTNVYTITDGFEGDMTKKGAYAGQRKTNGWKNANLPWTYELEISKMYDIQ